MGLQVAEGGGRGGGGGSGQARWGRGWWVTQGKDAGEHRGAGGRQGLWGDTCRGEGRLKAAPRSLRAQGHGHKALRSDSDASRETGVAGITESPKSRPEGTVGRRWAGSHLP